MEEYFKEFTNPSWKRNRFLITLILSVIFIAYLVYFKINNIDKGLTKEELKASVEFFDISSQWIEKEKVEDADFKGIIMVPQISFRIRNRGEKLLKNLYILGVFRKLFVGKAMGEGFKVVLKKGVQKDGTSKKIVINSSFGYRATTKKAFMKGSDEWGKSIVEIYIKSSRSKLFFIKSFYIRQIVEGMAKDVLIK